MASAQSTLLQIQQKVRLITRKPSEQQLTTDQLNQYINTFIMYYFPQHLKLYNLRKTFKFYTQPNVDYYPVTTDDRNSTFFGFTQNVTNIHPPVFLAGIPGYYTQWRDQFFGTYPKFDTINNNTGLFGNGTAGPFHGHLLNNNGINQYPFGQNNLPPQAHGVLQRHVIISTIDDNNLGLTLVDYPLTGELGILALPTYLYGPNPITTPVSTTVGTTDGSGNASGTVGAGIGLIGQYFIIGQEVFVVNVLTGALATANGIGAGTFDIATGSFVFTGAPATSNIQYYAVPSYGTVNYLTGKFTAIFPSPTASIGAQQPIVTTCVPYQSGKPLGVLYYDQAFTVRPVPDKVYEIQFEADVVPSQLLSEDAMPTIQQWWSWIALGAARIIFQDNMDYDSAQLIEPEFREQEALVYRATINNRCNSRTETIYTQGKNYNAGGWFNNGWPY
jgi:hypothetical protein